MAEGGANLASGGRGRPRSSIDKDQVEYLRFTWGETAALLGTSSKTLQRRAKDWSIASYSTTSDQQLDEAVRDKLMNFPSSGEVMIRGHLLARKVCEV